MRAWNLSRYALTSCVATALLVGCGGSGGSVQLMPTALTAPSGVNEASSWMNPRASGGDLLYATDGHRVLAFSFPQGALVGTVRGLGNPRGLCSDGSGNVFVVSDKSGGNDEVLEFAHGGTSPVNTLSVPDRAESCAVDPATNNLAVITNGVARASVAIFRNENGSPTIYSDTNFWGFAFCGYDNKGNLFFDGDHGGSGGQYPPLVELKSGSQTFTPISVNKQTSYFGGVQWEKGYLAVEDTGTYGHAIDHIKLSGSGGRIIGTTPLGGPVSAESWIQGGEVAAAILENKRRGSVSFYHYPLGGKPIETLPRDDFRAPSRVWGVTVSVAPSDPHIRR